ncbi:segregation and condensation protein B [Rhizobiales bacterium GAS113]|nr:segregation and condensation protein B [Rhizobiales bacterium GAS113]
MGRRPRLKEWFDTALTELPQELRWREWMGRVEAVIFASPKPVSREILARVVGQDCNLDLIIDDIRDELRGRPYDLVAVAGGWQHRTRRGFADAIRTAAGLGDQLRPLSPSEMLVLTTIAYHQPITRGELSEFLGREISRDVIGQLRGRGFVAAGPRSPQPGAPYTFVTTPAFLSQFGLDTLRDLPDIDELEEAGLLSRDKLLKGEFPGPMDIRDDQDAEDEDNELDDTSDTEAEQKAEQ